jgi:protein AaeX
MTYSEVSLFGIFVSPFPLLMLAAWIAAFPLVRIGNRLGLARNVWHPPLFNTAVYVIVLSTLVLAFGLF